MFTQDTKWVPLSEVTFEIWSFLESFIPEEKSYFPDTETGDPEDLFDCEPIVSQYTEISPEDSQNKAVFKREGEFTRRTVKAGKNGFGRQMEWVRVAFSPKPEVTQEISQQVHEHVPEPDINYRVNSNEEIWEQYYEHYQRLLCECVWSFIDTQASEAHTLLPNGSSISVSSAVFHRSSSDTGKSNTHINILIGTIGSGHLQLLPRPEREQCSNDELLRVSYGDFLHLPVLFNRDNFETFFIELKKSKWKFTATFEDELVAEITHIHLEEGKNKKEIKSRSAPYMKNDQWEAIWKKATIDTPSMKKPGRKPSKK